MARAELSAAAEDPGSWPACDIMTSRPLLSLGLVDINVSVWSQA